MKEDTYRSLASQYSLPDYNDIDKEFGISPMEAESFILSEIARKMRDHIEEVLGLIEVVLHPNPDSMSALYECQFFSNEDKKILNEIFKEVMFLLRSLDSALILRSEKDSALAIKDVYESWLNQKRLLVPYFLKLKESWRKTISKKPRAEYFG